MLWNTSDPATRRGMLDPEIVPSPSWPSVLAPQHHATPLVASAHECDPAAIALNAWPPVTGTGRTRLEKVPSPRLPRELFPQQNAAPAPFNPQLCPLPAVMLSRRNPALSASARKIAGTSG